MYFQRLRDLREDSDLTQEQVANFLGMKQPQYARYESGLQEIPLHHFIKLGIFYNVSLDYLAGSKRSTVLLKKGVNYGIQNHWILKKTLE